MPMPKPAVIYSIDSPPVLARGLACTAEQLDKAIKGPVKDILVDAGGTANLMVMLSNAASTDFNQERISQLFQAGIVPNNSVIGEALAEAYVSENDKCIFPWPKSRDLKNPNASPAGADLVGFQETDDQDNPYRFAFGKSKHQEM